MRSPFVWRKLRAGAGFTLALLSIEFLDELVFGAREAAWPLIRSDLGLSYVQVGILLSVPNVVSSVVEPILGILADVWRRRALILAGGLCFALALLLTASSMDFWLLLASFILFYPASGAFVSLSQAALMDMDASRHEHNMARWTLAGSLGVAAGPLLLSAATLVGWSWRTPFLAFAGLALLLVAAVGRFPIPTPRPAATWTAFKNGLRAALAALRRGIVLRWLALLTFSDLMLDVLLGFLALYFVDAVGATPAQAGLAVGVWTACGLVGDFLLIPLLERVRGLRYLRLSALVELPLFAAFLLLPGLWPKVVLLGLLGLFNAGWYSILQAQLYTAMPGQSGTTLAVSNIFGLAGAFLPLGLGWIAQSVSLSLAMWLLLLGPIALLVGLPACKRNEAPV